MHSHRMVVAISVAAVALVLASHPSPARAATAARPSDFDGDGYADLAIGVRGETIGPGDWGAGAVNVLYGSAAGLVAVGDQYWSQDSPGVKGVSRSLEEDEGDEGPFDSFGDGFGEALASGDFNRDGYADLAIGVPGDWVGTKTDAGAVNVLYGSRDGLTATGDQYWTGIAFEQLGLGNDRIGIALAAGDFDGDGYWDLATAGVDDPAGTARAIILRGSAGGLTSTRAVSLATGLAGSVDLTRPVSLAAGDLDGDGIADLVVGQPGATVAGSSRAGAVSVFHGRPAGPNDDDLQGWTQDSPGIADDAEAEDEFGSSLAVGDFDADGYDDVAIGARLEGLGECCGFAGAATVIYGSRTGLTSEGSQVWHQDVTGVPGRVEPGDWFAAALAAGDFDGDGADDLAIGVPSESIGTGQRQGSVVTLYGGPAGLSAADARVWTQDSAGIPGQAENHDQFGMSLASGNYGRSRKDDLAIGVPSEDFASCPRYCQDSGVVDVLYGRASGLSGAFAQAWSQNAPGIKGTAAHADFFGSTLGQ